jgi:hypothetical protein
MPSNRANSPDWETLFAGSETVFVCRVAPDQTYQYANSSYSGRFSRGPLSYARSQPT